MKFDCPYKILGVRKNASEKTIKKAYRKFANTYHPASCMIRIQDKFRKDYSI